MCTVFTIPVVVCGGVPFLALLSVETGRLCRVVGRDLCFCLLGAVCTPLYVRVSQNMSILVYLLGVWGRTCKIHLAPRLSSSLACFFFSGNTILQGPGLRSSVLWGSHLSFMFSGSGCPRH